MKKALLTLALAVLTLAAGAQNKWVAGGTGHFSHDLDKNAGDVSSDVVEWRIEPFVGYNIDEHWRVGFTVGYLYNHTRELDALDNLVDLGGKHAFRFGPYLHYNILRYNRWILFVEAEALFITVPKYMALANAFGIAHNPGAPGNAPTYDMKRTGFDFTVKPGVTYELSQHVNIDLNLNLLGWFYSNSKEIRLDTNAETTHSSSGLQLDMLESNLEEYWQNITLGITFKF